MHCVNIFTLGGKVKMVEVYVWLGILAISVILEFLTLDLVSIWVALGSLIAMILALCGVQLIYQIISAGVVSIACILCLRRFCLKFLNKDKSKTNLDMAVGVRTKLLKSIGLDDRGEIKYNGIIWTAMTDDDEEIEQGELVEIVKVNGNKMVVKKVKDK